MFHIYAESIENAEINIKKINRNKKHHSVYDLSSYFLQN